jgi:hypothetical protein
MSETLQSYKKKTTRLQQKILRLPSYQVPECYRNITAEEGIGAIPHRPVSKNQPQ